MTPSRFDATGRLARRVLDGEVVFFIGSGFSIDSEGNDANRLVGRLLAGLLAMGTVLAEEPGNKQSQANVLLEGLGRVFGLAGAERAGGAAREPARCMTEANLKLLAREYYSFNDWAVSALSVLSGELRDLSVARCSDAARRIQKLGTFLLSLVGDRIPIDVIDCRALRGFGSNDAARGKAIFLDIMGFANEAVMAGAPGDSDVEQVARSYQGRLRPRHHALARLAREGLAAALVTTNYDLLLEGAYRLAGFVERENQGAALDGMPSDTVPRFSRISGADQFFARGQGYRTALLLKIHGCALAYRQRRDSQIRALLEAESSGRKAVRLKTNVWAEYLPALVFTYREIQTWRTDAWSRDLIRTLLRTHTIALCGYSGADPVMHATFREVYDEKTGSRASARTRPANRTAEDASVFFFGRAGIREFHSLEILRAATTAAGFRTGKLLEHPNHIEFARPLEFPTLDDHFRWLTHSVLRTVQAEALVSALGPVTTRMFQLQRRDKHLDLIRERFDALCEAERTTAAAAGEKNKPAPQAAREFDSVVGWTWHFVPGFLRELAIAEMVQNYHGGHAFRAKRQWAYYHPASEHPERTAWAVIVELALRSLVAALPGSASRDVADVVAEDSPHAAVSFNAGEAHHPIALCIRTAGFERPGRTPALVGAFRRVTCWELGQQDVPWPINPRWPCPSAAVLWEWALGKKPPTAEEATRHLGVAS